MPQARHALYAQGEELHVSVWPCNPRNPDDIARFIALEGRVFSLAANGLLSLSDVPAGFALHEELQALDVRDDCRGGSAIAGPDGRWLVEPVVGEERLVVADLELGRVAQVRQNFDPTGHCSHPDVSTVQVDRRRQQAAEFVTDRPRQPTSCVLLSVGAVRPLGAAPSSGRGRRRC